MISETGSGSPVHSAGAGIVNIEKAEANNTVTQLDGILQRLSVIVENYSNLDERIQFVINKAIGSQPTPVTDEDKTIKPIGSMQMFDLRINELNKISEDIASKIDYLQDII